MKLIIQLIFNLVALCAINAEKKKILSFGGNGMIGSNTLLDLIATDEYDITLVSRGSWPFDTETTILPFVDHIYCDRENDVSFCSELLEHVKDTKEYYAVLDFSGFLPSWIEDSIKILKNKVRVYIYISSDSVYEVCGDGKPLGKYQKLVETDAVRPIHDSVQRELNAKDEYGNEKLECEEVLVEQGMKKDGFPYVLLRYADVIGPHDDTDRFATYVIWAKLQQLLNREDIIPDLHTPEDILESSSITYVNDATQSIISAMSLTSSWNEAYNIASSEVFNVTSAVATIATKVYRNANYYKTPVVIKVDSENGIAMYPSVTRGPVSIAKAIKKLQFSPTILNKAISDTVSWYLDIFETDLNYRDTVVSEWEDNLLQDSELVSRRLQDKIMKRVWAKLPDNPDFNEFALDDVPDDDEEL